MDMAHQAVLQTSISTLQKNYRYPQGKPAHLVAENPGGCHPHSGQGRCSNQKQNIGNMHMAEGKRTGRRVAVDDKDVAAFRELQELG